MTYFAGIGVYFFLVKMEWEFNSKYKNSIVLVKNYFYCMKKITGLLKKIVI